MYNFDNNINVRLMQKFQTGPLLQKFQTRTLFYPPS